ncbi:hypothetical protein [Marinomonas sp. THO17]|uniref:hypothetical protein n=1 Tax=Marinomonas sp. THO17 TaxID=3149048 RepID=UPI00336C06C2
MLTSFIQSQKLQWLGFVVGLLVISVATLTPMEHLPDAPGSDKLHHVIGFGGWALMCAFGPLKRFLWMAVFIFLWGGVIELIQPSVNRYGEWLDFYADGLGVFIVVLLRGMLYYRAKIRQFSERQNNS